MVKSQIQEVIVIAGEVGFLLWLPTSAPEFSSSSHGSSATAALICVRCEIVKKKRSVCPEPDESHFSPIPLP